MKMLAYVLLSGGIDSTTCLYQAIEEFGKDNVRGLSLNYGQRHSREIMAANAICSVVNIPHRVETLAQQPPSMLTVVEQDIPNVSYDEIEGVSPTYVPFRNGQLLSYATALLAADLDGPDGYTGGALFFGAHAEDAAGWAYPDCTPEFIGAMANAIQVGTYFKCRLFTPLEWMTKQQIISLGTYLNVPWELTWSCYKGGNNHCGVCPTCRARHDGFVKALVTDPTIYEQPPEVMDVAVERP